MVRIAEVLDRLEVERIAERMRDHDGLRLRRISRFELRDVDVVLRYRDVDEDRHGAVVHNG